MMEIKTWRQRCEEHPAHQSGMVSHRMIQDRMQEEIDELRSLPKMQKVDLDGFLLTGENDYCDGNNKAIELIKSKFGELYVEVK